MISIHAPLAGCDHAIEKYYIKKYNFNPRTPCGVRPASHTSALNTLTFQSTHPLRGATLEIIN